MGDVQRWYKDTLSDSDLEKVWEAVCKAGLSRKCFYGDPPLLTSDFSEFVRQGDVAWWLLCFRNEIAGMMWLTNREHKTAQIHFCGIPCPHTRTAQRIAVPVVVGRYAVASVLRDIDRNSEYVLNTIIGKTPAWNHDALHLVERCGSVYVGEIPDACLTWETGETAPGIITYFNRESTDPKWCNY